MNALKACWIVRAGLIPGEEMKEYRGQWSYTSEQFEADGRARGERFRAIASLVNTYADELAMGGVNWVKTEYMWL